MTVRRLCTALLVLLLALLPAASPATAAGTGDIELVPAPRDGQQQSSFRVLPDEDAITFDLMNLAKEPRSVRLYPASATESPGGAISTGAEGSAPWLRLPAQEITLAGQEVRTVTAALDLALLPEGERQLGVVVLEALQGAVTVRVATLVTVDPHEPSELPLWLLVVAGGSIATTGLGVLLARRRRRPQDAPAPAPVPELVGAVRGPV